MEAAYPKKRIKRAGVDLHLQPDLMMTQLRCTRLLDPKGVTEDRVERWLIDLADYAIIYMQPLLCMGIRQWAQRLPKWQKAATDGLLNRTPKKELAARLGVSRTTVHSYQLAAQRAMANALQGKEDLHRRCAVLGFTQWNLAESGAGTL